MQNSKRSWRTLVQTRVADAVSRSLARGCGTENRALLEAEAWQLLNQQRFKCALCGTRLSSKTGESNVASLDRIFSSVKPSPTREARCGYLHNCRWVCWTCNHLTRACHMPRAKWKDEDLCKK